MNANLWKQVENQLSHHQKRGDATAMNVLNRLLQEQLKRDGEATIQLDRNRCAIRRENWDREQLQLLVPWHKKAAPRSETGPIVVVEYQGKYYVVDGSNRVNKWLSHDNSNEYEVIIITSDQT